MKTNPHINQWQIWKKIILNHKGKEVGNLNNIEVGGKIFSAI